MSPSATNGNSAPSSAPKFGPDTKVAVIGAGVSGINTAAYLIQNGIDVTVFERSDFTSGVWHYDSKPPKAPNYPSVRPSAGDYEPSKPGQFTKETNQKSQNGDGPHDLNDKDEEGLRTTFAPPGPCYAGLRNNVPTSLLYSNLGPWPEGTEDITSHYNIESYLQGLSLQHGVNDVTVFNTRVEDARKSDDGRHWNLRTITLLKGPGNPKFVERTWEFDALVVASGHYNLPRIPDTPGLAEWKAEFGDRIIHTKEYRHPKAYKDKTVLVIGGGASAMDVCRESTGVAKRVIQSTRGGDFDLPPSMLPETVEHIGAIEKFVLDTDGSNTAADLSVRGRIVLKDGQTVRDVDYVVLATGYLTSYPFIPQYHSDTLPIDEVTPEVLVTSEGNMVHHLHKDIFYIEDPSLSFIGVPYYSATFSLFDFQAQVLARVYSGKTKLPSQESLRADYKKRVAATGRGRGFHSLAEDGAEPAYVKDLLAWANSSLTDDKIEPLKGHSDKWLETYWEAREKRKQLKAGSEDHPEASWPPNLAR
ncbi:hypothetical protein B0T10DRAFT_594319 [Thelonectria olida]|uniref:FAD dependent oxidoreductase domain-containing protein n=1 Tax=Thelonectria olida TaxID=1576542 RepID=A0A9P8W7R0_9HYPO|nr:hypothetical protein B0T10DRAFT_594319 [Thelonectria olida]